VVVQGDDYIYHYNYSASYWFRFKVSNFPDWSTGRIIAVAMKDHGILPVTIKNVQARALTGEFVKLYPK
jgi:hypothetical protein